MCVGVPAGCPCGCPPAVSPVCPRGPGQAAILAGQVQAAQEVQVPQFLEYRTVQVLVPGGELVPVLMCCTRTGPGLLFLRVRVLVQDLEEQKRTKYKIVLVQAYSSHHSFRLIISATIIKSREITTGQPIQGQSGTGHDGNDFQKMLLIRAPLIT